MDKFPDVKFMLKAIGTAEDARRIALPARRGGGCICSNHGGPARLEPWVAGSAAGSCRKLIAAVAGPRKIAGRRLVSAAAKRQSSRPICLGRRLGRHGPGSNCYGLAAAGRPPAIERVIELLEEEMKEGDGAFFGRHQA